MLEVGRCACRNIVFELTCYSIHICHFGLCKMLLPEALDLANYAINGMLSDMLFQ